MKYRQFIGIFLCVFLFSIEAQAQLKLGISEMVQRTWGTVQTKVEEVTKQYNVASKEVEEQVMGNPIKVKYETLKAMEGSIGEQVSAGLEEYAGGSGVADAFATGQSYVSDASSTVGDYEAKMDSIASSDAASLAKLEKENKELKKQMEERKEAVNTEYQARIKAADENIDIKQQFYEGAQDEEARNMMAVQIAMDEAIRDEMMASYENFATGDDGYAAVDEEYAKLQEQYKANEEQRKIALENKAQSKLNLGSVFARGTTKKSKEDRKADYQALGESNFVSPDEKMSDATVKRIQDARNEAIINDVVSAFSSIVRVRSESTKVEDKTEEVAGNSMEADYDETAKRLANQQVIDKIKRLSTRVDLEVQELKLATSANMRNQGFRMNNPNKNASELNLDNYVLTEDELRAQGFGD